MTKPVIKSPGSKELFERWNVLADQIREQGAIIQNAMELTQEQIEEWLEGNHQIINVIVPLINETWKAIYDHANPNIKPN